MIRIIIGYMLLLLLLLLFNFGVLTDQNADGLWGYARDLGGYPIINLPIWKLAHGGIDRTVD